MTWREDFKVHPVADIFPMMSDEELRAVGEDIKANGLKEPITLDHTGQLCDGRNRMEAMERAGINLDDARNLNGRKLFGANQVVHLAKTTDVVAFIISKNIHRRHLTKQQQADLIVAAHKAGSSRQDGEVITRHVKGKRGSEKDSVKAAAIETAKEHGISPRTIERSLARVATRKQKRRKPKLETYVSPEIDDESGDSDEAIWSRGLLNRAKIAAGDALYEDWSKYTVTEEHVQAATDASTAWHKLSLYLQRLRER